MRFKIDKTKSITHNDYWRYEFRKPNSNPLLARLKRIFKFIINSLLLNKFGFRLVQVQKTPSFKTEQWSFTNNKEILFLRNQRIVDHLINFGFEFGLNFEKAQLHKNIERYDEIFRMGKISDLNGGMGYNNGLLLYIILTYFNPQVVLESGVWRGFTTFLIDDATQDSSKIFCFDINLDRKEFTSNKASYFESDLSLVDEIDFRLVDFAFFDDHVSIYERLLFCLENSIEIVVVDDDVAITQVHSDGWPPIPTASMLYDYDNIPKQFGWTARGVSASANISGIKVNDICEFYNYIPFPNLAKYTGYKDSSYSSLLMKR